MRSRRRRHTEEHTNHERWLVSYADFITLLFAFFVVMYAISSINEGKYRVLSESLIAAFRTPPRAPEPIQVGNLSRVSSSPTPVMRRDTGVVELPKPPIRQVIPLEETVGGEAYQDAQANLATMAQAIVARMKPLIEEDLIHVRLQDDWLEVEIKTRILFPSAEAELAPRASEVLTQIAEILADFPNSVRIEGFTDDLPINSTQFPSNWELSAARSARVARLMTSEGVAPQRLSVVGFSEYRPIADNRTPEGRNQNRRVVLVVLAGTDTRDLMDMERLQGDLTAAFIEPDQTSAPAGEGSRAGATAEDAG